MSLTDKFLDYAADEGYQTAIDELQDIQQSLETLLECNEPLAAVLLQRVNDALITVVERQKLVAMLPGVTNA
jgi:hypothetical protein